MKDIIKNITPEPSVDNPSACATCRHSEKIYGMLRSVRGITPACCYRQEPYCKSRKTIIFVLPKKCDLHQNNLRTRISDFFKRKRTVCFDPEDMNELGYPKEHMDKIMAMLNGEIKPGITYSNIDNNGVTHTKVIYPNSDEK